MKRLVMLLALAALLAGGAGRAAAEEARVYRLVAGTEIIADIARDLLGGKVEVLSLIPASSCPGHHDIRASDMAFFSKADMVIVHIWQKDYPGIAESLEAAGLPRDGMKLLPGKGSQLVPANHAAASRAMAGYLAALPGVDIAALHKRLEDRLNRVARLEKECGEALAPHAGTPALSAFMQKDFVNWAGMRVIADYGRGEDMSPGMFMDLARQGRQAGARVVVDNLQSGAEAGLPLAKEIGAAHVAFSNFPGNSPETLTYEALIRYNVEVLNRALSSRQAKAERAGE